MASRVRTGRTLPQPPGQEEEGETRSGAGLGSSRPQPTPGPGVRNAARVPDAPGSESGARPGGWGWSGGGEGGRGRAHGKGGDASLPTLAALQQARAADKGRPRPRHASTHRAAPSPGIQDSSELQSRSACVVVTAAAASRALMGAGGGWGARGAGRAAGSLGPGKAAGCAQSRDWPRGSSMGPRPEPARWADPRAWTPPLTPVQT